MILGKGDNSVDNEKSDTWKGWQDESIGGGRAASRSCLSVNLKKKERMKIYIFKNFQETGISIYLFFYNLKFPAEREKY